MQFVSAVGKSRKQWDIYCLHTVSGQCSTGDLTEGVGVGGGGGVGLKRAITQVAMALRGLMDFFFSRMKDGWSFLCAVLSQLICITC